MRRGRELQDFLIEIVLVDPLDLVMDSRAHADVVPDHEASQFYTVDQNDALRALRHIGPRGRRETGGGDEHALGRTRRVDRTGEAAQIAFSPARSRYFTAQLTRFANTDCRPLGNISCISSGARPSTMAMRSRTSETGAWPPDSALSAGSMRDWKSGIGI